MRLRPLPAVLVALVFAAALLSAPAASAHAPLGAGDNESLATATVIPDPTKSWAIYADLHERGETQYYRFAATQGDAIAVLPIALGALTLWLAFRRSGRWARGARVVLVLLGVAGLFVWARWIAGPIIAVLAALLPSGAPRGEPGEPALR